MFDMSLVPYIVAGAVVIVISVIGLFSDSINRTVRWILIGVGIIIGFGIIAAVITGGFGLIGSTVGSAISNAK